jgi:hypothetical protein
MMSTTITAPISIRDRAVLRAVAAGRCGISTVGDVLTVDGICFADQFAGHRLASAGLIAAASGQARLTASGQALLAVA